MCARCVLDVRATPLTVLAVLRGEPGSCLQFRQVVDREIEDRLTGMDLDDPCDEQIGEG